MKYKKRFKQRTSLKQEKWQRDAADTWLAKNDKPKITRADLEKIRTSKGGFKRKDLEKLGVPWPLPKGWLKKLVGNEPFVMPPHEIDLPAGKFVFRRDVAIAKYHLKTEDGTLCVMQNSYAYRKLDSVSDVPPAGRKICGICDGLRLKEEQRAVWQRFEAF